MKYIRIQDKDFNMKRVGTITYDEHGLCILIHPLGRLDASTDKEFEYYKKKITAALENNKRFIEIPVFRTVIVSKTFNSGYPEAENIYVVPKKEIPKYVNANITIAYKVYSNKYGNDDKLIIKQRDALIEEFKEWGMSIANIQSHLRKIDHKIFKEWKPSTKKNEEVE